MCHPVHAAEIQTGNKAAVPLKTFQGRPRQKAQLHCVAVKQMLE